MGSLRTLLTKWEYTETATTAVALKEGSFHQQFNDKSSSNLAAKLDRMDSKERFMSPQSAGKLMESVECNHLKVENGRLREELDEIRATMALLENDKLNLGKALKLKIARIRQIEEERGIVIGE